MFFKYKNKHALMIGNIDFYFKHTKDKIKHKKFENQINVLIWILFQSLPVY
jgi:hypothetical protein